MTITGNKPVICQKGILYHKIGNTLVKIPDQDPIKTRSTRVRYPDKTIPQNATDPIEHEFIPKDPLPKDRHITVVDHDIDGNPIFLDQVENLPPFFTTCKCNTGEIENE